MAWTLLQLPGMTSRPHDALFKAAFDAPEHAAAMFRDLLPASVSGAIAWESMIREVGSFVDPELADHHTDLLFSVRLHGNAGQALLYLLLEHQSTNDADMPLRVLVYLVRIWERFRKDHAEARLPPIIPVVVSHVPGGWTAPRTLEEMFEPHPASIPGLGELVPRFSLVIEDLAHLSNDQLKARTLAAFPRLALWALRDARDAERFLANLGEWAAAFAEALRAPHGIEAMAQLMRYIALVTDVPFDVFRAKIREQLAETDAEDTSMTMAEQLIQEGRIEGEAKGRMDALRKLLVLKFGAIDADHAARIDAATPELLDRYLERVLTATTVAAVFGED